MVAYSCTGHHLYGSAQYQEVAVVVDDCTSTERKARVRNQSVRPLGPRCRLLLELLALYSALCPSLRLSLSLSLSSSTGCLLSLSSTTVRH